MNVALEAKERIVAHVLKRCAVLQGSLRPRRFSSYRSRSPHTPDHLDAFSPLRCLECKQDEHRAWDKDEEPIHEEFQPV